MCALSHTSIDLSVVNSGQSGLVHILRLSEGVSAEREEGSQPTLVVNGGESLQLKHLIIGVAQ